MLRVLRGKRSWAWGLAAGLALRSAFVAVHPLFVGDTLVYGDLAHNLLAHNIYGLTEGGDVRATLIRLPGYPVFLALCFVLFGTGRYLAVIWVQIALDLWACVLLGAIAGRLFGRRAATVCLWVAALCPFTANYAAAALTETGSIFCVVLALWGLVVFLRTGEEAKHHSGKIAAGAAIGGALSGAYLLRPDGILLAVAILPAFGWAGLEGKRGVVRRSTSERAPSQHNRSGWRAGSLLAFGLPLLCLALWTARNWRVYHVFQPLAPKYANDPGEPTPAGFARWYRTWGVGLGDTARVYWEYDGSVLSLDDLPPWAFDSPGQRARTAEVYARYNEESSSTPASEADFNDLAAERSRAHPLRVYLLLPLARLADMWLRPRTELFPHHMPLDWWSVRQRPKAALFAWSYGLLNLALLGCAGTGLLRWWRRRWRPSGTVAAAMLGYAVLRSLLLMTIDNSEPRYVLEAYPVVILLAAVALAGSGPAAPSGSPR